MQKLKTGHLSLLATSCKIYTFRLVWCCVHVWTWFCYVISLQPSFTLQFNRLCDPKDVARSKDVNHCGQVMRIWTNNWISPNRKLLPVFFSSSQIYLVKFIFKVQQWTRNQLETLFQCKPWYTSSFNVCVL